MSDSEHRRLGAVAAQSHGIFTRIEARGVGISDRTLSDRAKDGRYERIRPGVYAIAGAPRTLRRQMAAAVASFPALAAISHQTAAELWGLTERGIRTLEVVTTRWDRVHRRDITVHESLDLVEDDIVVREGVPVTTAVRGTTHRPAIACTEFAFHRNCVVRGGMVPGDTQETWSLCPAGELA